MKILSRKFLFRRVLACLGFLVFHQPIDEEVFNTTIFNASCFTNGTFGVCKLLGENFGFEYGTTTTIHSYNGDKMILDGRHSDLLRDRVGAMNIVPNFIKITEAFVLLLP